MSQPSHKVQQKRNYVYRFNRLSENIRAGKVSGSEELDKLKKCSNLATIGQAPSAVTQVKLVVFHNRPSRDPNAPGTVATVPTPLLLCMARPHAAALRATAAGCR